MAHRRSFPRRSPSLRSWSATNDGVKFAPLQGSLVPGAQGNTGTPVVFIGAAGTQDFTVLRTRGFWQAVNADTSPQPSDQIQVSVSLGVIPEVAGQSAFPTPIVDADWDGWFLHQTIMLAIPGSTGGTDQILNQFIDSKAMRKVHGGDSIIASFDSFNVNGTTSLVNFAFWARFLLKLS